MPDADLESLRSGRIAHETAVHVNSGIFFEGVSKRGLRDHSVRRFPNIAALIEKHNHQLPPVARPDSPTHAPRRHSVALEYLPEPNSCPGDGEPGIWGVVRCLSDRVLSSSSPSANLVGAFESVPGA